MKIFSREELELAIKGIVEDSELNLFDIDYPTVATPTLRVYVWRPQAKKSESVDTLDKNEKNSSSARAERRGVTLDECAKVARSISEWFEKDEVGGSDEWLLEVSSPGVNRRLRLREHFQSAVGERVKLTLLLSDQDGATYRKTIVGKIEEVGEHSLTFSHKEDPTTAAQALKGKSSKGKRKEKRSPSFGALKHSTIELDSIEEARVDFVF